MTYRLLLVESPAKQKRIAAILGQGWRVEATRGHVRDLPQDKLGVEVDQDFRPQYEVLPRQVNTVKRLLKAIREAESVFVATDLDREGEAIAAHQREGWQHGRGVPLEPESAQYIGDYAARTWELHL